MLRSLSDWDNSFALKSSDVTSATTLSSGETNKSYQRSKSISAKLPKLLVDQPSLMQPSFIQRAKGFYVQL